MSVLMFKARKDNRPSQKKCGHCDIAHAGTCYAKTISDGKTPDGWASMDKAKKERIAERAEKIKPGCTKEPTVLSCEVQEEQEPTEVVDCLAASVTTYTFGADSLGAPGSPYHFIRDRALMQTMLPMEHPITVNGVEGTGGLLMVFVGTAAFETASGDRFMLGNCLFNPGLPKNIINVWQLEQQGGQFDYTGRRLLSKSGKEIQLGRDTLCFEARPIPTPDALRHCEVLELQTVQRGARGKLHIDMDDMSDVERAEFYLQLARFNDPPLGRATNMGKIADGVPAIFSKANAVNTVTDARMLADPPTSPPKAGSTPRATKPGQLTQADYWSGPCVSLIGNKGAYTYYDSFSSNCAMHPVAKKSDVTVTTDQYYLNCKARGIDVDRQGGVLYTDNEIVLNSAKRDAVAASHGQTRANSIEYRPTGNSGAESTFRIVPNSGRTIISSTSSRILRWRRSICLVRELEM